jgi:xanthine dehydrogenase accessory factor
MADPAGARIWIQGAGELASGVAWRLVKAGWLVLCAERPEPLAVRRLVCFASAVRAGRVEIAGIPGVLRPATEAAWHPGEVTVLVDPEATLLPSLDPAAVVDARMTKRPPRPLPLAGRPLIGLGPGFACGRDAALIVETQRGPRLGAVLSEGEAAPDTGVPGEIGGEGARRLLRAPRAGRLEPRREIGDLVGAGETVAFVGGAPVVSLLDGRLRGLAFAGTELRAGEKVGDVDPRGAAVDPRAISDKALAVAEGVLEALKCLRIENRTPD